MTQAVFIPKKLSDFIKPLCDFLNIDLLMIILWLFYPQTLIIKYFWLSDQNFFFLTLFSHKIWIKVQWETIYLKHQRNAMNRVALIGTKLRFAKFWQFNVLFLSFLFSVGYLNLPQYLERSTSWFWKFVWFLKLCLSLRRECLWGCIKISNQCDMCSFNFR